MVPASFRALPAYIGPMRAIRLAAASVGVLLLLTACGSTAATDPAVQSASDSGAVAGGASACPSDPPARKPLKDKNWYPLRDGVVGAIYNETSNTIYVGFPGQGICGIAPGGYAPYSVTEQVSQYDNWVYPLIVSATADGYNGVCVAAVDPDVGYPGVLIVGKPACSNTLSASREYDDVQERMSTLSEDESVELRNGNTVIVATRLEDDGDVAKQWTGSDTWAVTDWARIDLRVKQL